MFKRLVVTMSALVVWLGSVPGWVAAQAPRDRTALEQRASDEAAFERKAAERERAAAAQPSYAPAHHAVAAMYLERARDQALGAGQKRRYLEHGIAAVDRALAIDPAYVDALVHKSLLLRMLSFEEADAVLRDRLVLEAEALRSRALDEQRRRPHAAAIPDGTVVTPGPPPPPPPPAPGARGPIEWVYAETAMTVASGEVPVRTKEVKPIYAPMAIAAGIEGEVVLEVQVDERGTVARLQVVRTQPLLTQATIDAVRQWTFDAATVPPAGAVITVTARFTPPRR